MAGGARRSRPPRLTREIVAKAALEAGLPQLIFTTVWERPGVGESTLFRYAPDRDELIRLELGLAMESVEMPPRQRPWWQVSIDYAVSAWRFWKAYPGSATKASQGVFALAMVRLSDELRFSLMEYSFAARNALLTCGLVLDMVADSRRGVKHMDGLLTETGPERDDVKR